MKVKTPQEILNADLEVPEYVPLIIETEPGVFKDAHLFLFRREVPGVPGQFEFTLLAAPFPDE